jgi:phosphatidylglycerophosphatase A
MNKLARELILFIAQGAYAGKFPVAPGTAGTLVGVLIQYAIRNASLLLYISITLLLCIVGTWAAGKAEIILGRKDSPSIVIDEIAGFLIAMFMVPSGWGYVAAGFALFRLFDIIKPWPLHSLQAVHGGLGIMIDDIGAGIYANIVLQLAAFLISR